MRPYTALVFAGLLGSAATTAQASYMVSIQQSGSNVVATGSGSIDLAAFSAPSTVFDSGGDDGAVEGDSAVVEFHLLAGPRSGYLGVSGPTSFGSGDYTAADSTSGATVALFGSSHVLSLVLSSTYVSGSQLGTSTDVFDNTTIDGLGLTPGFYEWTWGSGATADFFSIQIGPDAVSGGAVPEPGSIALLGLGIAAIGVARRKRNP